MKYSLAIIALLGLTNAIQIVEEPATVPSTKPDPTPKATEAAAKEAGKPAPKEGEQVEVTKTKKILQTEDEKSEEAAMAAGKPIDLTNAPLSGLGSGLAPPSAPLTDA
jgi:hypothetical protein